MLTVSIIILLLTVLVAIDDVAPGDRAEHEPARAPVSPVRPRLQSRLRLP